MGLKFGLFSEIHPGDVRHSHTAEWRGAREELTEVEEWLVERGFDRYHYIHYWPPRDADWKTYSTALFCYPWNDALAVEIKLRWA